MSIASFSNVLKIFGGGEPSAEEKPELFKETTLMALARATSADSNIKEIEVDTVRLVVEQVTGESVEAKDVRLAANSKLFESAPLERQLTSVGKKLDITHRVKIVQALLEVVRSDDRVSWREVDFFNMVARSLNVSPAELVGLISED